MKSKNILDLRLPDLLAFVKQCCHENLHDNLVELREHSQRRARICHLAEDVLSLIRRIQHHLAHEENNFFPLIEKGDHRASNVFPIHALVDEHDELIEGITALRTKTNDFEVTPELTSDSIAYYGRLVELERILTNHTQIQNRILYPMVLKIS
jgi:iron-sulfur cluster repair protein YtfE (RIC family)